MRVLIAGQTYRPAVNGAAVFTINLAEGLARAGHQVVVLVPSDRIHAYRTASNGVHIEAVRALPLVPLYSDVYVTLQAGRQVRRLLGALAPDIVHIQDHYPLSRTVVSACLRHGLPLVATNHFLPENVAHHVPVFRRARRLLDPVLWGMVLEVFNHADAVTSATETAVSILREQGLRPPAQAISCGVDLERFRRASTVDRAAVRLRYGLDPQRPLFLYLGRLDPEKRLDVLLRALRHLGRSDLQLAIVGRGRRTRMLRRMTSQLGLDGQVVFTGYVPGEDLPALLTSADVFAMPSEAELQSIATLEAMATGRPVLAADARALPELVWEGVNGRLFRSGDPHDAARCMAWLLDERERWGAMGAASHVLARGHSVENTIRRYEELYMAVLGSVEARRRGSRSHTGA
ncbi:MAG: glycosyltransferase [Anaerolineae bacterium]|nr:glycosyltransferase [Anaerolineae bacterium]